MKILTYTVPLSSDGRMIKRIIRGDMRVSQKQLAQLKSTDGMLLDGTPVHANAVVRAGQVVTLRLPEGGGEKEIRHDDGPIDIVYENEDLLIVNKSAPLACQSSFRQADNTLENKLSYYFRDTPGYIFRPVNRLDKGTSGLMAVAKHAHAQTLMSSLLHTGGFVRRYRAIVCGQLPAREGTIDLPIAKGAGATIRRVVDESGRRAVTRYRVEREENGLSLVRLTLETGRTHQIRVHMCAMGCPVLGDFLYGEEDERLPGRFALHSCHMEFTHPLTGEDMAFDAPLPRELSALL
ncbi:MAG: RluA family pseudouridine synthase [Christensenellales bacterium]|jgi:23S rRNA pseudouridine1911/1915/1917 synthase